LSLFDDFDFFFHGCPSYPILGRGSKGNDGQGQLRNSRWPEPGAGMDGIAHEPG